MVYVTAWLATVTSGANMLTEVKNNTEHYFKDEHGDNQGEYKMWYESGHLCTHCIMQDGVKHGESKKWDSDGHLIEHSFYVNDVKLAYKTPILHFDKLYVKMLHGINFLPV